LLPDGGVEGDYAALVTDDPAVAEELAFEELAMDEDKTPAPKMVPIHWNGGSAEVDEDLAPLVLASHPTPFPL
jgi:hypothetical protein